MVSVLVAQYVQTSGTTYGNEADLEAALATVIFVVANAMLLVVHAARALVAAPFWKKASAVHDKLQEHFAAGADTPLKCVICGGQTHCLCHFR